MSLGWVFGRRAVGAFARADSGNVAMLWALMGTVLIGLVGLTVDFTRAQSIRAQLQNAADGAVLVAERSSSLSMNERRDAARAFFDAEIGRVADEVGEIDFEVTQVSSGGHRVEASVVMPMSLARLISDEGWRIGVDAEAQAEASPPIEVALALDNTGSMANDMQTLRDAATDLTNYLMDLDGDSVSISLVPFVAQVNIGSNNRSMVDQTGASPYNGELLEDRSIAFRSTSNGRNSGNCNFSTLPFSGYTGPYRITWVKSGSRCYAFTPADGVSNLALYDLLTNVDWKGCVEARPAPYDVQDDAPSAGNPATLFTPFFWIDTVDGFSNSYLTDTVGDISGATMSSSNGNSANTQQQRTARTFNVFKYRNNSATVDTSAPETRGPNRGCPTPIVPLTQNRSTLLTAISQMQHWMGGGTNQVEGLAWAWRVLSPGQPFTQGAPYGDTRKVIVLMSDGQNTNVGDDPVLASDYAGMNHLGLWRDLQDGGLLDQLLGGILHGLLPSAYRRNINSPNQYVDYVNDRERELCENIKDAGIEIYAVIFRETDRETERLMDDCASDDQAGKPKHFHRADSAQELHEAFQAIGSGIGQLRITH